MSQSNLHKFAFQITKCLFGKGSSDSELKGIFKDMREKIGNQMVASFTLTQLHDAETALSDAYTREQLAKLCNNTAECSDFRFGLDQKEMRRLGVSVNTANVAMYMYECMYNETA